MLFASFWVTPLQREHVKQIPFMGNTEVPFDEIRGHDDVVLMEKYIKNKINRDALYAYVENITIINWKRFNT